MQGNYAVVVESFAERHFIKSFEKKYKSGWLMTRQAITAELERLDSLLLTDRAETITTTGDLCIIKTKFKVAGTNESAKTSGNRCIVALHKSTGTVHVLLVYGKTDLKGGNETANWKKLVREAYPEYREIVTD